MQYFQKMKGLTTSPPRVRISEMLWSWLGSFLGIAAVALVHYRIVAETDLVLIINSGFK